jgi:hypothetical protein
MNASREKEDIMRYPKRTLSVLLMLVFVFHPCGWAKASGTDVRRRLAARVGSFDNHGKWLTATLLEVAAEYHLPMGIEKVTPEALHKSIDVRMRAGTVSGLLDLCVKQLPDYSWSVLAGAVLIYGPDERGQASNLFNFIIPTFSVKDSTMGQADWKLRNDLDLWVARAKSGWKPGVKPKGAFVPGGIEGSYISDPELEKVRISLSTHGAPIREVLNRMVALQGRAVWVALVYPENLSEAPNWGLWMFLHRGDLVLTDSLYDRKP